MSCGGKPFKKHEGVKLVGVIILVNKINHLPYSHEPRCIWCQEDIAQLNQRTKAEHAPPRLCNALAETLLNMILKDTCYNIHIYAYMLMYVSFNT